MSISVKGLRQKVAQWMGRAEQLPAQQPDLRCNIERLTLEPNLVRICGWAWSMAQQPAEHLESLVQFELLDADQRPIRFDLTRAPRPDVASALFGTDTAIEASFEIVFASTNHAPFHFTLTDGFNRISHTIPVDDNGILPGDDWTLGFEYDEWFKTHRTTEAIIQQQRRATWDHPPLLSILMVLDTPEPARLRASLASLQAQSFPHWELCAVLNPADSSLMPMLTDAAANDTRIRWEIIPAQTSAQAFALSIAKGAWVSFLGMGDLLEADALYEIASAAQDPQADFIYVDEDRLIGQGDSCRAPHFKPDFSPEYLLSCNYIGSFFFVRQSLIQAIHDWDALHQTAFDYDLVLRCTERAQKVLHLSKVLYHKRALENEELSTHRSEAEKAAIESHLRRTGQKALVTPAKHRGFYHVQFQTDQKPLISILIANRDEMETLRVCLDSVFRHLKGENVEILILENGSQKPETFAYYRELEAAAPVPVRILTWNQSFNYAAIHNWAVPQCSGELLLLLNNDTEVLSDTWLDNLSADCLRDGIGAVGAKLLYPDGTIQHAGVVVGLGGIASHVYSSYSADLWGYDGTAAVKKNESAVTAACVMVRREVWEQVQGMDEDFVIGLNDIDLCLKIVQAGWRILYDPEVCLKHYESKTRGHNDTPEKRARALREEAHFLSKWSSYIEHGGPYYSPNLSLAHGYLLNKGKENPEVRVLPLA